jgi:hypothetical protein
MRVLWETLEGVRSDIREAVEAQLHAIRTGDEPLTSIQLVGRASGAPSAPCEVRATATIGKRKLVVVRRADSEARALTMAVAALMATTAHMVERPSPSGRSDSPGRDAAREVSGGRSESVQPILIGLASSSQEDKAPAWLQRGNGSIVGEAGRIGARLESVLGTVSATGGRAIATIGNARGLDLSRGWRGGAAPAEDLRPAPRSSREPIPLPFGLEEAPSRWNAGRVAGLATATVVIGLLATSGWWSGVQLRAQPLREALAYLPSLPSFGAEATESTAPSGSETGPLASVFSAVAGGPEATAAFGASVDASSSAVDVAARGGRDPLDDPFYWAIASAP